MGHEAERGVGDALLAALSGDTDRTAATGRASRYGDLSGLAAAARHHRLAGYVLANAEVMSAAPLPEAEAIKLRATHDAANHLRVLAALGTVAQALERARIAWCVIKGPVLAEAYHRPGPIRGYDDLDILVAGEDLGRALNTLEAHGGAVLERNWRQLRQLLPGEVHVRMPGDVVVDLHWHLIPSRGAREAFSVRPLDVLRRRRHVDVGPVTAPTPAPEDTILHLAVHTMLSGADRLIWFKDLERVAVTVADWDAVVRRARSWGVSLALAASLRHAMRLTDVAVPPDLFAALGESRTWRAVTSVGSRVAPIEKSSGDPSLHRLISRACRTNAGESLKEALRRTAGWMRSPASDPPMGEDRLASSVFAPIGDDRDRSRFLESVARASIA